MNLNKLLDKIEDSYAEYYYLTKQELGNGVTLSVPITFSNLKGLQLIKGPKTIKPIDGLTDLLTEFGIEVLLKLYKNEEYRFSLVNKRGKPVFLLFGEESIEIKIETEQNLSELTGLAKDVFNEEKIFSVLENIHFQKNENLKITINLIKESEMRKEFEKTFSNDAYLSNLKRKLFDKIKYISTTKNICQKDIDKLTKIGVFSNNSLPMDQLIQKTKDWVGIYEGKSNLIPTTSSIFELETISKTYGKTTDYNSVIKKLKKIVS